MDKWKDIKNYEGLYKISSLGEIKNLKHKKEKEVKQVLQKTGYLKVILIKDKKPKAFYVHRLVAQAFIPNIENKSQVNHKDGNKQNNNINNLEWNTPKENVKHAYKNGLSVISDKQKQNMSKIKSKKVDQYDLNGNFIKTWKSLTEVEKELKISDSTISACCNGKKYYKTAGGFIWRYANDSN